MESVLPYAERRRVFQPPDGLTGAGLHPFDDLRERIAGAPFADQDAVEVVGHHHVYTEAVGRIVRRNALPRLHHHHALREKPDLPCPDLRQQGAARSGGERNEVIALAAVVVVFQTGKVHGVGLGRT